MMEKQRESSVQHIMLNNSWLLPKQIIILIINANRPSRKKPGSTSSPSAAMCLCGHLLTKRWKNVSVEERHAVLKFCDLQRVRYIDQALTELVPRTCRSGSLDSSSLATMCRKLSTKGLMLWEWQAIRSWSRASIAITTYLRPRNNKWPCAGLRCRPSLGCNHKSNSN